MAKSHKKNRVKFLNPDLQLDSQANVALTAKCFMRSAFQLGSLEHTCCAIQFTIKSTMRKTVALITIAALVAGCATAPGTNRGYGSGWEPVVDVRGHQQSQYPTDLMECQQHATKVMDAQTAAVQGAVAGAIFGALLGAAAGGGGRFNRQMAGVGALSAGAGAAANAEGGQRGIISRCLMGRGYSVLN